MSKLTFSAEFKQKPTEKQIRAEIYSQAAPEGHLRYPELKQYKIHMRTQKTVSPQTAEMLHNLDCYQINVFEVYEENKSAKAQRLKDKINTLKEKKQNYIQTHGKRTVTAAFITCPKCNSKINKDIYKIKCRSLQTEGWFCPVCENTLESTTFTDRINKYNDDIKYTNKLLAEELKKPSKNKYYLALATIHE